MKITRNPAKTRMILDALRASFTETRTGVHLSDLLKIRQAHWQRVLPIPPSDTDTLYFLAGRGHEEVFARMAGVNVGASEVQHVPVPGLVTGEQRFKRGISYRPDFRWLGTPTEFKTRRSNLAKEGEEATVYDNYLEQLRGYCALDGVSMGHLVVFSLLEGRSYSDPMKPSAPELVVYEVEFTPEDLAHMNQTLDERYAHFLATTPGLSPVAPTVDPKTLPLCQPWMCGKNIKVVVKAAHCIECNKELAEPWASKHAKTKGGAGHTVTPEEVRWDYTPRCKHFVFCRPYEVDPLRQAR